MPIMNHSCDPNVVIEHRTCATAVAVAKRDIKAGEELCNSYIDLEEANHLAARTDALRHYNFVCDCALCGPDKPAP